MDLIISILQSGRLFAAFLYRLPYYVCGAAAATLPVIAFAFIFASVTADKTEKTKRIIDFILFILIFLPPMLIDHQVYAVIAALPLMCLFIRHCYDQIDRNTFNAAKTLGLSSGMICTKLIIPQVRGWILGGIFLGFVRAFTELSCPFIAEAFGYFAGVIWVVFVMAAAFIILSVIYVISVILKGFRKK